MAVPVPVAVAVPAPVPEARYGLPIHQSMGRLYRIKTTIDIADALLSRAKRQAKRTGKPLRALVEEGLRRVLAEDQAPVAYQLPDLSVGRRGGDSPLDALSWPELRDQIYGGR